MTGNNPDLGTPVVHRCETVAATGRKVVHVVLPPRHPSTKSIADLRDAGYDVVAFGVFPGEVPECPEVDAYPWCEHLLIQRPNRLLD